MIRQETDFTTFVASANQFLLQQQSSRPYDPLALASQTSAKWHPNGFVVFALRDLPNLGRLDFTFGRQRSGSNVPNIPQFIVTSGIW